MEAGFLVWWRRGEDRGVLVSALRAAEVQQRLQEAIEDLQHTLCEVAQHLPPVDEGEEDADGDE